MVNFFDRSYVELIKTNSSDEDVARAAWVSNYGDDARTKDADKIKGLINFLWRENHTSPFEHGSFTFYVKTPLFVAREFMRHRTQSYNEVSGRYKVLENNFYLPGHLRPVVQQGKIGEYSFAESKELLALAKQGIIHNSQDSWDRYQYLLDHGIAPEVARMVLPVNIMTEFYATVNPLNLMKFLSLREDNQALYEIRDVAWQMEQHLKANMPISHAAWEGTNGIASKFEKGPRFWFSENGDAADHI